MKTFDDPKDRMITRLLMLIARMRVPLHKSKSFMLGTDMMKDSVLGDAAKEYIDQIAPLVNAEVAEIDHEFTRCSKQRADEIELLRNKNAELRNVINRLEAFAFADDPRGARDYIRDHVKGKV